MRPSTPDRDELSRAAVELLSAGSGAFKGTARRFSLCEADADDAYQRGLEILLTKAPTEDLGELKPWLHTVIKHEALLIRRQRERMLGASVSATSSDAGAGPEERAPEKERARRTAEALAQLKPGEVECLLLKALGYSYDEIAERTGFSWTKVACNESYAGAQAPRPGPGTPRRRRGPPC
jgi:RNA polymerase sigma factor (sigma-70 family)